MRVFVSLCWFMTALIAAYVAVDLITSDAPERLSVAAIGAALVIVPYVFTRAMEALVAHAAVTDVAKKIKHPVVWGGVAAAGAIAFAIFAVADTYRDYNQRQNWLAWCGEQPSRGDMSTADCADMMDRAIPDALDAEDLRRRGVTSLEQYRD